MVTIKNYVICGSIVYVTRDERVCANENEERESVTKKWNDLRLCSKYLLSPAAGSRLLLPCCSGCEKGAESMLQLTTADSSSHTHSSKSLTNTKTKQTTAFSLSLHFVACVAIEYGEQEIPVVAVPLNSCHHRDPDDTHGICCLL